MHHALYIRHRAQEHGLRPPFPFALLIFLTASAAAFGSDGSRAVRHWAFQPVQPVEPPPSAPGQSDHPIDRFVRARLTAHNLHPVHKADRPALCRRLYFDLVGLPPTPAEMDAFAADPSASAYMNLVDRLLASPRYGERWGRYWMDVVRYADTAGDNADYPIPEAHLYRDYIIDSFNADKPYDQFVREQLAGDILAAQGPRAAHAQQCIATGFLALSRRYATAPFELWHLTLEDTIETTGRAFMGLTLRCARCHDHKYDPTTKEDYYALYGIFASTQFPYAGSEEFSSKKFPRSGFVPLLPAEDLEARARDRQRKIDALQQQLLGAERQDPLSAEIANLARKIDEQLAEIRRLDEMPVDLASARQHLQALQKERTDLAVRLQSKLAPLRAQLSQLRSADPLDGVPVAYSVVEGKAQDVRIHIRGNPDQSGPLVKRGMPRFLLTSPPDDIPDDQSGRLQLARWLTRPDHPLTARVMVNRLWQHLFGRGIVATPSNFGLRGDPPSHPELLDYLASRFVREGWSIKSILRHIVLSDTYQLATADEPRCAAIDPGNKLYWRHDCRRLEAEAIRDALLYVSGRLDPTRPGPQPFPAINTWTFTQHNPFKAVYDSNHRSVYLMTQRIQRHPFLALFDGPDTNTSTDVRSESNVPLQALYLLNNPFLQDQSAGVAARMTAAVANDVDRLHSGAELAWCRQLRPDEMHRMQVYLRQYRAAQEEAGMPAAQREADLWSSYARLLLLADEFVYID